MLPLIEPMRTILCDKEKFEWTDKIRHSLETVKNLIAEYIILTFFDLNKQTVATTPDSNCSIFGVLSQILNDQETVIVCRKHS